MDHQSSGLVMDSTYRREVKSDVWGGIKGLLVPYIELKISEIRPYFEINVSHKFRIYETHKSIRSHNYKIMWS